MTFIKKAFLILSPSQRKRALPILFLMMVGMALEMLSLGLIIPVVGLMVRGDYLDYLKHFHFISENVGSISRIHAIYIIMAGLFLAYAVKNIYLGFLAWRQITYVSKIQIELSHRLFAIYLRQPYSFHLQRNSSQLLRNIIGEVNIYSGAISHFLQVAAEGMVLVGAALLLIFVEPVGTIICVLSIGGVGWLLLKTTKSYTDKWGNARQFHDGLRIQFLQEGIGGVKDVKLLRREKVFIDKHTKHNLLSAQAGELQTTVQQFPKLVFEQLAILGFALLVITMVSRGQPIDGIMPTLGLFAAAAFRLMPSASRILSSLQTIRFSIPAIDTLHTELELEKRIDAHSDATDTEITLSKELRLNNVSFMYAGSERSALKSISIDISRGEAIGIIGASGSGKSSLIDVILGLLTPTSGQILADGKNIQSNLSDWQKQIGYVPQSIFLIDDTLRRNIAFGLTDDLISESAIQKAIAAAQLQDFILDLPAGLETIVGERGVRLSGGQRQRIGIARALYHNPHLLVLDEATSALDVETEIEIMHAVNAMQGDKTIIMVSHRLSTVEHCNRIYRFENGEIAEYGTPNEILDANQPKEPRRENSR